MITRAEIEITVKEFDEKFPKNGTATEQDILFAIQKVSAIQDEITEILQLIKANEKNDSFVKKLIFLLAARLNISGEESFESISRYNIAANVTKLEKFGEIRIESGKYYSGNKRVYEHQLVDDKIESFITRIELDITNLSSDNQELFLSLVKVIVESPTEDTKLQ